MLPDQLNPPHLAPLNNAWIIERDPWIMLRWDLLAPVVVPFDLWGALSLWFSNSGSIIYTPRRSVLGIPFPVPTNACFYLLVTTVLIGRWWFLSFLGDTKYFSCTSLPLPFEKCLVRLFAHFLKEGLIKIMNISQVCVVLAQGPLWSLFGPSVVGAEVNVATF